MLFAIGLSREEALKSQHFARGQCFFGEHCALLHEVEADKDLACGICFENPRAKDQKFGIPSNCNHIFCYPCLMEWRKDGSEECTARHVCPTCRKQSNFVVPSYRLPKSDEDRLSIVAEHTDKLAKIPCKHFDGELGSCMFGSDCLFGHIDEDGNDVKNIDRTMQEMYEEREAGREVMIFEIRSTFVGLFIADAILTGTE